MGKSTQGISGTGIAALAGGSLLLWSALKGRKWTEALRELISGEQPKSLDPDYPITSQATSTAVGTNASGWESAKASSYWSPQSRTASGAPMTPTTIASPYLPIGTKVEIEYKGKTATGTVQDFGPADWVMIADPTRFLDIAGPMMVQLSGKSSNLVNVKYRILQYGTGKIYRPGAAKTAELRKRWAT